MKPFYLLQNLLRTLSGIEIQLVKYTLKFREKGEDATENLKSYKLLELLLAEPSLTMEEITQRIYYQKVSKNKLRGLIYWLLKKITESLMLDANLGRKKVFSPYYINFLTIKKGIVASHILRTKGLYTEVVDYYDTLIARAKKHEFYEELIELLRLKKAAIVFRHNKKDLNKLEKQIALYERCKTAKYKAQDWYYQLYRPEIKTQPDYLVTLEKAINELEEEVNDIYSNSIGYYLHLLKLEYYQQLQDYDNAYQAAHTLLKLTQKPALNFKPWRANAYLQMAEVELLRGKFSHAANTAFIAMEHYPPNTANYSLAYELKFYAHFYIGQLNRAEAILKKLLGNSQLTVFPSMRVIRNYCLCCVYILKKKYDDAELALRQTVNIDNEGEQWKTGVRLLTILLNLEGKQFFIVENHIINFKQYAYRNKQSLRKREYLILTLLIKLMKAGFDYKKIWEKYQQQFALLASEHKDYCWEIKSPEMIVFHEWFKAQALHVPYLAIVSQHKKRNPLKKTVAVS